MNDESKQKIKASTERYYRDLLGLPDWQPRAESRLARKYEAYMFQRLINFAGSLAGKSVLDLGCGWGGVVLDAAEQGQVQSVVGLEPDEERLAIAQELLKECGAQRAEVFRGIGEKLPFADNSFDCVTCGYVLEYLPDPEPGLAELGRVLKPGGSLLLAATEDTYTGFMNGRMWKCRTFNRNELRLACTQAGLPWNRQLWFTKAHQFLKLGGIIVEAVKEPNG